MNKRWRETFLLHSESNEFKEKVSEAKTIIATALEKYQKPYVAFSGGKDSTCVLHLVLQQDASCMVLHWDYGRYYIPRKVHQEIIRNAKILGAVNLRIETSVKYEILGRRAFNVLGQDMLGKLVPQLIKEGYDVCFVGLRVQESPKRKRRIQSGRALTKLPEIFPVRSWSWMDVWAYIVSHNLPYLSHYDLYAPIIGWDKVRFTTFFDPEFDKLGCSNVDGVLMWKYKHI